MKSPDASPVLLSTLTEHSRVYAGIGARATPPAMLILIRRIARALALCNLTLRSGGAPGADLAFEAGCDEVRGEKEIFLPWQGFNGNPSPHWRPPPQAEKVAALCHPNWRACSTTARRFHARNVQQVCGKAVDDPVGFVLFWAREKGGWVSGGTGMAVHLARRLNIPTYNLYDPLIAKAFEALTEQGPC